MSFRCTVLLTPCLALAACGSLGPHFDDVTSTTVRVARTVADCRTLLAGSDASADTGLEAGPIELLSWNVKKGSRMAFPEDLSDLSAGKDIVALQEAVLGPSREQALDALPHRAYSEGYASRMRFTGVATFAAVEPLGECRFSVIEPWLKTPKATSITEFPIIGRADTLVVVNVHAINFSLGQARFQQQLQQIERVLDDHDGPIILSGDLNTWSRKRMQTVDALASRLGLIPVGLQEDLRTTFNGLPLDHVFVRGLAVESSETVLVSSSDHNPISVRLRL